MKLTILLLVTLVAFTSSCSKSDDSQRLSSSKQDALPEAQVVEIVNAVGDKDVNKVSSMLQGNPKLVRAKFSSGGPVSGWPLLMIAARQGDKPVVELLLRSGADVNDRNYSDETALHYAALHGHKEIVQLLLEHKADANARNDAGATPLIAAEGKPEIIALLKRHGAK